MTALEFVPIHGSLPHVIPTLLQALRRVSPDRANTIACINWWVVVGIRKDEIKDAEMVTWLFNDIIDAFNEVAPCNTTFGHREPDLWGYWPDAKH